MKLSTNVTNIKYAIRDVVRSAQKVEKQGKKLFYFNIGDPDKFDFDTPEFLKEALVEAITKDNANNLPPTLPFFFSSIFSFIYFSPTFLIFNPILYLIVF